jgi:hypothetical protein
MAAMQGEVYAAFRAMDIPEEKALKAAEALSKRDDDVSGLRAEVRVNSVLGGFVLAVLAGLLWQTMQVRQELGGLSEQVRAQSEQTRELVRRIAPP